MAYTVELTRKADKQLQKLPEETQRRIVRALEELEDDPRPHGSAKLKGEENLYRIRMGDYRIIYSIEDNKLIVIVVRVGHRRDIYNK
ncbi:mRNA interferase RelE [hydrothermal vent metagenome]|uniref:mRNA interferase RelE n=1 Tax=hydrothermal vent metagenome TaxID=652676 RepID=A0A3B1DM61_9ZZZZ